MDEIAKGALKDVLTVDHRKLQKVVANSYERKLPLFVWGTFGIGKSYAIKEFGKAYAKENGLKFSDSIFETGPGIFTVGVVSATQIGPAELPGLPFPDRAEGKTTYLLSELLPKDGQGIFFCDELNLGSQMVQSSFYSLIWDRRAGRYIMPEGWVAIGAGNTSSDRAHIQEFSMPLKNRMGHVQLMPSSAEDWIEDFARPNNVDVRITTFFLFKGSYLYNYNPDMMEEVYAIPTHRSWKMASDRIEGIEDLDEVEYLTATCVGVTTAYEFVEYIKMYKNYNMPEIFEKEKVDVPDDPSELYALLGGILEYFSKHHKKNKSLSGKIFALMYCFNKEHAVILLKQSKGINLHLFKEAKETHRDIVTKAQLDFKDLL